MSDETPHVENPFAADAVAQILIALCEAAGPGKTISPTQAAQKFATRREDDDASAWRSHLPKVRASAIGLARAGALAIFRKGKPVDPDDFRGVYRIGLPPVD